MVDTKANTINRLRHPLRQYISRPAEGGEAVTEWRALKDLQGREVHREGQAHRKEREQP